jgi:hypothetical protein
MVVAFLISFPLRLNLLVCMDQLFAWFYMDKLFEG